jgi:dipeptidyl aminopeptidase/acylaminoacyl peptidase
MSRATGDAAMREKVVRLFTEWAKTVKPDGNCGMTHYPCEKLVGGLVDSRPREQPMKEIICTSFAKGLLEKSLGLRRQPWRSAPVLGRSNIGKAAGVDFSSATHSLTLLRRGTGALRWRTFQTGSTTPIKLSIVLLAFGLLTGIGPERAKAQSQQRGAGTGTGANLVFKSQIAPHWFQSDTCFWYRNDLRGGAKEFILVNAGKGAREKAFDHARLAAALTKAAGTEYQPDHLPFDDIEVADDLKAILFQAGDASWRCDLPSYTISRSARPPAIAAVAQSARQVAFEEITPETEADGTNLAKDPPLYDDSPSPDGKWTALIKEHNVFIRGSDGQEVQLSRDGVAGNSYGRLSWSPDSKTIVASKIEPAEYKSVYQIQSSPPGGGRANLRTRNYPLPGDQYTTYELWVFDVENRKGAKVEAERVDFYGPPKPRWSKDGKRFLFQKTDRGHQRFRVFEVKAQTGNTRTILDDKSDTFISTTYDSFIYYTEGNNEIIYASERDGWKHLYLIDVAGGKIKNQITKGPWVMRGVTRVDEVNRQVWFRGSGRNPDQDPYLVHHYRVNFDGTGLIALTEGNGNHTVHYSPDERYLIDTYSRVDAAPVNELRRVSDGKLVCQLEAADISELKSSGWEPPEVFVAKGRDDKTDIWGIIVRPRNFDPNKEYPILEDIYAGPHDSFVPKSFNASSRYSALTDLGFLVVKMDGMGTANRSKAFHDVCWHDLADAGLPDRIRWIKAAAGKYPCLDLTRVGIYGTSAGAQNAAGAVLFHPEFYKAAVANCGCHDNRMDKASWNEQWMGYPVGPWYAASSNIENAAKLRGNLFLIVGELDNNVPPENTLRFADALIKAGKDFDLLVVPNGGHGAGNARAYVQRRLQDFFVRHLQGIEPPDRNGTGGEGRQMKL